MSHVDGVDDGVGWVCGKAIINVGMVCESNIYEINDLFYSTALLVDSNYSTYNNLYNLTYSKHIRL